ncbi:MAG: AraC family transcriptional regulator [Proteobacteria bacterium]|nr:AraC family transcriptional regulator [Pseudomonadota bacterium]MBU1137623.1 AraC family transcriptional regulator [Pseudomonadota bacterium]MBU1233841.1 AraC family transcriptional regulator [Pseudomonadota bacterium]MBU1417638.1 AraC family transcriptional regulator [Pseudomonadota bacterium]MBU1456177.1 AraC family transcriptional regulator [Pseudomonadota bacterium]
MNREYFFKDRRLPFVEARYSQSSQKSFKPHLHQAFSVGAVETGKVRYQVQGKGASLAPGALALINPDTLHSCNSEGGRQRSYYMLYLEVDWCLQIQKGLWPIDSFVPVTSIRLLDDVLYHRYTTAMQCLLDEQVHLLEKEQNVAELLGDIFSRACRPHQRYERPPEQIERFKILLSENLEQDLSLNSFASQLKANLYTLLRQFKAMYGVTPHAYRMNCRIELARRLLQQGKDIGDTALECGFFDQSHLHRTFKAMTTVTPQQYRVNFIQ